MSVDDIDRWSVQEAHDDGNPHPLPLPLAWDCPPEEAAKIEVTLVDLGQCKCTSSIPMRMARKLTMLQANGRKVNQQSTSSAHFRCAPPR